DSGAAEIVHDVRAIGHETPFVHKLPVSVHRRQAAPHGKACQPNSVSSEHDIAQDEERASTLCAHRRECALEVVELARLQELKLYLQRPSRDLRLSQREDIAWSSGIPENGHPGDIQNGLLE